MRKYAPALEYACVSIVTGANLQDMNSDLLNRRRSSKTQPNRRKRILNILADIDSEAQLSKLSQLSVQSKWLEWNDVMCCDLTWRRLLHGLDGSELCFTLQAITNNLRCWDNNTCYTSFRQGSYTWRHNVRVKRPFRVLGIFKTPTPSYDGAVYSLPT